MESCKSSATPISPGEKLSKEDGASSADQTRFRSLVGGLLYLAATRPDILFAVNLLSRFMHSPGETHFKAAKRVLRYIRGTCDYGVLFKADGIEKTEKKNR